MPPDEPNMADAWETIVWALSVDNVIIDKILRIANRQGWCREQIYGQMVIALCEQNRRLHELLTGHITKDVTEKLLSELVKKQGDQT